MVGHFIKDSKGSSYLMNLVLNALNSTVFNVSIIDFTHAGVDAWWAKILTGALDLGYAGFMYDFGEYVPPDGILADGGSGHRWHNAYPLIYQRAAHRFFAKLDDDPKDGVAPDYLYYVRSAYAGSQAWTFAMWGGDPEADWSVADGLPASVVAGINAGLSGMPFWGSDTGGFHAVFVPPPTSELHKRWVQFSAFSGLMRDMTAEQIVKAPINQIPIFVRLGAVIPMLDPRVDTLAPASPPAGVEVTTAADRAAQLHAWIFPGTRRSATLSDGATLSSERETAGVRLKVSGGGGKGELWAQVFWPGDLKEPAKVAGLTRVDGADPLTLSPGTWTYSSTRGAAALHGKAGARDFLLEPGP